MEINGYNVISIGEQAFGKCDIKGVVIRSNISRIEEDAFSICPKLKIYFESTEQQVYLEHSWDGGRPVYWGVQIIEDKQGVLYAVKDGEATVVDFKGNVDTITIPSNINGYNIVAIGEKAFANSEKFSTIVIPSNINEIGYDAFAGCEKLSIYCEATTLPSNWNYYWNSDNRPVYWYSEQQPTIAGNYWHYVNDVPTIWQTQA